MLLIKRFKIILPLIFLLLIIISSLFLYLLPISTNKIIYVNEDGFSPREIEIKLGDKITFINNGKEPVWPASDNHPTHESYPDFDIKKPLAPNHKWIFFIKKSGIITFHDHLNPANTGFIKVSGGNKLENQSKKSLILKEIDEIISNKGTTYALNYFVEKYPQYGGGHDIMHYIGIQIYKEGGIDGIKTCNSSYAFGCHHGFIEQLINQDGFSKMNDLTKICNSLNKSIQLTCYHGIGHGLTTYHNYDLQKSLKECDRLFENEFSQNCYGGVFMENIEYAKSEIKLHSPLWPCTKLDEKYKEQCYFNQRELILAYMDYDLEKALGICESVEENYRINCIRGFGGYIFHKNNYDLEKSRKDCLIINANNKYYCIISVGETSITYQGDYDDIIEILCNPMPSSHKQICIRSIDFQLDLNNFN